MPLNVATIQGTIGQFCKCYLRGKNLINVLIVNTLLNSIALMEILNPSTGVKNVPFH